MKDERDGGMETMEASFAGIGTGTGIGTSHD